MADHFLLRFLAFPTANSMLRKAAVGRRKCQFSQSITEIELHTWNAAKIYQRNAFLPGSLSFQYFILINYAAICHVYCDRPPQPLHLRIRTVRAR